VSFTDGMCRGCTARFRRQWHLAAPRGAVASRAPSNGFRRVAVVLMTMASLALAAHQLDDGRVGTTMTPQPETVLVPTPLPAEEEPMPSLAVASGPRRLRSEMPTTTADVPVLAPIAPPTVASVDEPPRVVAVAVTDIPRSEIPTVAAFAEAPQAP
jgi:hypothetical protein